MCTHIHVFLYCVYIYVLMYIIFNVFFIYELEKFVLTFIEKMGHVEYFDYTVIQ